MHLFEPEQLYDTITDFNGNRWSKYSVAAYNDLTRRINQSANRPISPGSLTMLERDTLLDMRHSLYLTQAQLLSANTMEL